GHAATAHFRHIDLARPVLERSRAGWPGDVDVRVKGDQGTMQSERVRRDNIIHPASFAKFCPGRKSVPVETLEIPLTRAMPAWSGRTGHADLLHVTWVKRDGDAHRVARSGCRIRAARDVVQSQGNPHARIPGDEPGRARAGADNRRPR